MRKPMATRASFAFGAVVILIMFACACGSSNFADEAGRDARSDQTDGGIVRSDVIDAGRDTFDARTDVFDAQADTSADAATIDGTATDGSSTDGATDGATDGSSDAPADAGPIDVPPDMPCTGIMCGVRCIDPLNDPRNCGRCARDCTSLAGVSPTIRCIAGACDLVGGCMPGRGHCGSDPMTGCDTDFTGRFNCGACGMPCSEPTPMCTLGSMGSYVCASGCSGMTPTRCPVTMSCVSTMTDPRNCGACGTVCTVPNGTAACVAGACAVGTCNTGFANCDGMIANGCETNTAGSLANCGGCGTACNLPNAAESCVAGVCTLGACDPGFADCNANPADGCETSTTANVSNCGACGRVCTAANGVAGCAAGVCTVASCNAGFANCDGLAANGCEATIATDRLNCGACGNSCATRCTTNVTATTCAASACSVVSCTAGAYDINGACMDGCECSASSLGMCAGPTPVGALSIGLSTTYTGNLVPLGAEQWLSVSFTGNTSTAYHPRIRFTSNPGAAFRFDIVTNCAGTLLACGVEGGNSMAIQDWETSTTAVAPGYRTPIPPVGSGGTVLVHVYRRAGLPVTCDSYTITFSN